MQGVVVVVLIWQDVVSGTINFERGVLDTVGVTA